MAEQELCGVAVEERAEVEQARERKPPEKRVSWSRDGYGALSVSVRGKSRSALSVAARAIQDVVADLERGDADEHRAPAWTTGIDWNRRRDRGQAINADLYGLDVVDGQPLGIMQVRQFTKNKYGGSVRKNWFLVGRNEGTGQAFAHPIEGRVVTTAIARDPRPASAVTAARAWIFEVAPEKLGAILRHGDVAAIPVRALPAHAEPQILWDALSSQRLSAADHILTADQAAKVGGRLYARGMLLTHERGQHADVAGQADTWYRIQVGLRADVWPFSRPTAD